MKNSKAKKLLALCEKKRRQVGHACMINLAKLYSLLLHRRLFRARKFNQARIVETSESFAQERGISGEIFKLCLINEAECLRRNKSNPNNSKQPESFTMPIALLLVNEQLAELKRIKQALINAQQKLLAPWLWISAKSDIRPKDQNDAHLGNSELFIGLAKVKPTIELRESRFDCNEFKQLTNQCNRYLDMLKQINSSAEIEKADRNSPKGKIGILISCFNPEAYIDGFLQNLMSMSNRKDLIPVFVNAGMTSQCRESIHAATSDAGFSDTIFIEAPGSKIYEAWNLGIKKLGDRVEFITNCNVDDRRHPQCLEIQSEFLTLHQNKQVAITDYLYFFEHESCLEKLVNTNHQYRTKIPVVNARTLIRRNFPHSGPLWRISLHRENTCGMFDSTYIAAGDADFWYLVSRHHPDAFGVISIPLSFYYDNPIGLSTKSDNIGAKEHIRSTEKHYSHLRKLMLDEISPEFSEQFIPFVNTEHMQIYAAAKAIES